MELLKFISATASEESKASGKVRLKSLLQSGSELKVFTLQGDERFNAFKDAAKDYGVKYSVVKRHGEDKEAGIYDIMVKAEDASKINRIFERFKLATVDLGSVKAEIEQHRAERGQSEEMQVPDRALTHQEKVEAFLDQALRPNPTKEQQQTQNPTEGRIARSRQSEPSSRRKSPTARDASNDPERRPSVRKELAEIQKQQKETAEAATEVTSTAVKGVALSDRRFTRQLIPASRLVS